jgi:hypothetical protein
MICAAYEEACAKVGPISPIRSRGGQRTNRTECECCRDTYNVRDNQRELCHSAVTGNLAVFVCGRSGAKGSPSPFRSSKRAHHRLPRVVGFCHGWWAFLHLARKRRAQIPLRMSAPPPCCPGNGTSTDGPSVSRSCDQHCEGCLQPEFRNTRAPVIMVIDAIFRKVVAIKALGAILTFPAGEKLGG